MSCRKNEGESLGDLTSGPQGRGVSQWCGDSATMLLVCSQHFLPIRETYLRHLKKTEKARLMIEHGGWQPFSLLNNHVSAQFIPVCFEKAKNRARTLITNSMFLSSILFSFLYNLYSWSGKCLLLNVKRRYPIWCLEKIGCNLSKRKILQGLVIHDL